MTVVSCVRVRLAFPGEACHASEVLEHGRRFGFRQASGSTWICRLTTGVVFVSAIAGSKQGGAASGQPRYEVVAGSGGSDLQIEATFPAGLGSPLVVDPDATAFVDGVSRAES